MDVENCPVPVQGSQLQTGEGSFGNTGERSSGVYEEGEDCRGQSQQRCWNKRGKIIFFFIIQACKQPAVRLN